jgi:hypothetical protein
MRAGILVFLTSVALSAQVPRVGIIEIFGQQKVPRDKILKTLSVVEGDRFPRSKADTEEALEEIPGVVRANLEAVCCEDGKAILYVGIEEKGGYHYEFNTPPTQDLKVPDDVWDEWVRFIGAVSKAAQAGRGAEDLTRGHSLMEFDDAKKSQLRFIELADQHLDTLREVLLKSADEEQRGIAAYVLQYSSKKKLVAGDLQTAMRDNDATVRNNAMRSLAAIAVLASANPDLGIKVPTTWFVEMLHSTHFTDRNKATMALLNFTEKGDESTLQNIRETALQPLLEMAHWRSMGHALPAFILLGRAAGVKEEEIQTLWTQGKREDLFKKIADMTAKKK